MDISKLSLKEILKGYEVTEQDFEYAGIEGEAEMFGWKIIFYKRHGSIETSAIQFFEIEGKRLIEIANKVMEKIELKLKFGQNVNELKEAYGEPRSYDEDFVDTIRYHYLLAPDYFLSIGLKKDKLAYLEIVCDEEIIREIATAR